MVKQILLKYFQYLFRRNKLNFIRVCIILRIVWIEYLFHGFVKFSGSHMYTCLHHLVCLKSAVFLFREQGKQWSSTRETLQTDIWSWSPCILLTCVYLQGTREAVEQHERDSTDRHLELITMYTANMDLQSLEVRRELQVTIKQTSRADHHVHC